jgi:hypothetical protein
MKKKVDQFYKLYKKNNRGLYEDSDKCFLYPKPKPTSFYRSHLTKSQLYYKYMNQKNAEKEFVVLQAQIKQTESLISENVHLREYYTPWLQYAHHTLSTYISIIEAPDAVSTSVSISF